MREAGRYPSGYTLGFVKYILRVVYCIVMLFRVIRTGLSNLRVVVSIHVDVDADASSLLLWSDSVIDLVTTIHSSVFAFGRHLNDDAQAFLKGYNSNVIAITSLSRSHANTKSPRKFLFVFYTSVLSTRLIQVLSIGCPGAPC